MTNRINILARRITVAEADRARYGRERDSLAKQVDAGRIAVGEWERARDLLNQAMLGTQAKIKEFIEEVVSLALSTIYGPEYAFALEYETRRNQVEATPWLVKGAERFSPRDEVGGGVLDVAALALRLALWAIMEPRPSATFLLDEPSKFLSADLQVEFGRMLTELAGLLGSQFVVVTHSPMVAEAAGAAYNVTQGADGISRIERIEQ